MGVQSLGGEDPLEEGMAIHSSILAGRILWTEEPGGLYFIGLQRVGHKWGDLAASSKVIFHSQLWYLSHYYKGNYTSIFFTG